MSWDLIHLEITVDGCARRQHHKRGGVIILVEQQALPTKKVPSKPEASALLVPKDKGPGALDLFQTAQYSLALVRSIETFGKFGCHEQSVGLPAIHRLTSISVDIAIPLEHEIVSQNWLFGNLLALKN